MWSRDNATYDDVKICLELPGLPLCSLHWEVMGGLCSRRAEVPDDSLSMDNPLESSDTFEQEGRPSGGDTKQDVQFTAGFPGKTSSNDTFEQEDNSASGKGRTNARHERMKSASAAAAAALKNVG